MAERVNPPLPDQTRGFVQELRCNQTDAERLLWYHLRAGQLGGHKFRRQHAVPPYVIDFYCAAAKLAVELDGSQHAQEVDAEKTRYLKGQGFEVVRFWNNDVLSNTAVVLESILASLQRRTLTPGPSPDGRGE